MFMREKEENFLCMLEYTVPKIYFFEGPFKMNLQKLSHFT